MKRPSNKSQKIDAAVSEIRAKLEADLASTPAVIEGEGGFPSLLGQSLLIMCAGYFYTGKLSGVNGSCIEIENAYIQYDADDCTPAKMSTKLRQKLPGKTWNIQMAAIESFGAIE